MIENFKFHLRTTYRGFIASSQKAAPFVDELLVALADASFISNKYKRKGLTTQIEPPNASTTTRGLSMAVVDRDGHHK